MKVFFLGCLRTLIKGDHDFDFIVFYQREAAPLLSEFHESSQASCVRFQQVLSESDIVHSSSEFDIYFCPLQSLGVPLSHKPIVGVLADIQDHIHPEFFTAEERDARKIAYPSFVKSCDLIGTLSDFCKKTFIDILGTAEEKIRVISLAPQFGLAEVADVSEHRPPQVVATRFVFYPSNFYKHKNHLGLLDALVILKQDGPLDFVTYFCGSPETCDFDLHAEIQRRGLDNDVYILSYVPLAELRWLYGHAAAMVFPSFFEGFGIPLVEAMRAGCLVVTSNAGSLEEIGRDACLYFDPANPQNIAQTVTTALADDDRRALLIARGYERARLFTEDNMVRGVLDMLYEATLRYEPLAQQIICSTTPATLSRWNRIALIRLQSGRPDLALVRQQLLRDDCVGVVFEPGDGTLLKRHLLRAEQALLNDPDASAVYGAFGVGQSDVEITAISSLSGYRPHISREIQQLPLSCFVFRREYLIHFLQLHRAQIDSLLSRNNRAVGNVFGEQAERFTYSHSLAVRSDRQQLAVLKHYELRVFMRLATLLPGLAGTYHRLLSRLPWVVRAGAYIVLAVAGRISRRVQATRRKQHGEQQKIGTIPDVADLPVHSLQSAEQRAFFNRYQKKVFLVIPVFNRLPYTTRLLQSLATLTYKHLEVIVVDDGSTDGTAEYIAQHYPQVHVLRGNGNLFWTAGTNVGVRYALQQKADYILTINNDVVVHRDFLAYLVDAAERNPSAIVGSRIHFMEDPERVWSMGVQLEWGSDFPVHIHRMLHHGEFWPLKPEGASFLSVDAVTGCGTLVPASCFREVGLYRQFWFPQYHADSAFCLDARKKGYRCLVDPRALIFNDQRSTAAVSGLANYLFSKRSPYQVKAMLAYTILYAPFRQVLPALRKTYAPFLEHLTK